MKIFPIATILALLALPSFAAKPEASPAKPTPSPTGAPAPATKETTRRAITVFRQDPFSQQGRAAGAMVRAFAQNSDEVLLEINEKRAPFLSNLKVLEDIRTILLSAYIVGNVDSQLLHNEKKDDPYAGALEVISVYKQMKKKEREIELPEVENFIDLEKRGELKSYLESP